LAQNKGPERVNAIPDLEAPGVTRGVRSHLGHDYFSFRGFGFLPRSFKYMIDTLESCTHRFITDTTTTTAFKSKGPLQREGSAFTHDDRSM
jgi:hypothetical protein